MTVQPRRTPFRPPVRGQVTSGVAMCSTLSRVGRMWPDLRPAVVAVSFVLLPVIGGLLPPPG